MKTEIIIAKVDKFAVVYTNSLGASRENFPDAAVGQKWEVTTAETTPEYPNIVFPVGVIVKTRLLP